MKRIEPLKGRLPVSSHIETRDPEREAVQNKFQARERRKTFYWKLSIHSLGRSRILTWIPHFSYALRMPQCRTGVPAHPLKVALNHIPHEPLLSGSLKMHTATAGCIF